MLSNWHAKRTEWLRVFVGRFVIVPSSRDLVVKWAEVMVAATAVLYGAPLITHNGNDYLGVPGLTVFTEASQ
jgi:predicted nucleic acid-binding protein